ncbi:hypothetical protein PM082_000531 [Marasmius tenuissimus]|nr:hypothetical protein PM082_000531 [Marasmius tenuissimus]
MSFQLIGSISIIAIAWTIFKLRNVGSREPGLPPGPPTTPLLGNIASFPKRAAYLRLTEWARVWGGMYSLKLGPATAVVISDATIVKEFIDKRGHTTSDRPALFIVERLSGGLDMALARYGDTWKTLRRAAHTILTPQMSTKLLPIQYAESTQLLLDIVRTPESFHNHINRYANSVIMSVAYGKRSPRYETPETKALFDAENEKNHLAEPGATPPLDFFPFLQYIPEWTGLAGWKKRVRECRQHQRDLFFGLLDETMGRMKRGEENGCHMEEVIRRQKELQLDREMMAYLGGTLLEGGSDTSSGFLESVVLFMVAFPEVQKKAQAELDRVVGPHRLPTLDDLPELPYIRAFIQEVHRFRPVAPLIPHGTTAPEEYKGYLIPKDAILFVNTWGILHDPEIYDDPESFNPDRYLLTENGTKPGVDGTDCRSTIVFGCGRRACPGTYFAQNSIGLNTMRLLWAFTFSRATDPQTGVTIDVDVDNYEKGMITRPCLFKASITPRSSETVEIIEREFEDATEVFAKFEVGLGEEDRIFLKAYRSSCWESHASTVTES